MASLMKKLFDTMPLAGVHGALFVDVGRFEYATLGQLARHLSFHAQLTPFNIDNPRPSYAVLEKADGEWHRIPIWGYSVTSNPARVRRVTCRARHDNFNNYVVLDDLQWGYALPEAPTSFREAVRIVLRGNAVELPLNDDFRLMTFVTRDGANPAGVSKLWPMDAYHDQSLLHVFAYDFFQASNSPVPLTSPDHPEKAEIDAMLARCQEINKAPLNDRRNAAEFLFQDDLWDKTPSATPPCGTVPENVDLSLRPVRVIVAVSLTVCRERDDFQPGKPEGVGRIYPHVMVVATATLDRVDAGVRCARPMEVTLLDAAHCGCSEMLSQMGTLLVTDSNADGMVLANAPGPRDAPVMVHANLFNYYVPDAFGDPELKNKALPVVRRSRPIARSEDGLVVRDCSDVHFKHRDENKFKVTKFPRQGMFDNIHVAPRMTVKDKIDRVKVGEVSEEFTTYEAWKMDSVVMAPFCPHDCFHMHWRWSNNANVDYPTFGWGPRWPNEEVGAVMVPENQDVFLVLTTNWSFNYLAQAQPANRDVWQIFCHHGAGYALSAGTATALARIGMAKVDGMRFERDIVRPPDRFEAQEVLGDWALFYWRLRYTFKEVERIGSDGRPHKGLEVVERFRFCNRARALDM